MLISAILCSILLSFTNIWISSTVVSKQLKDKPEAVNNLSLQNDQRQLLNTYVAETFDLKITTEPEWPNKNIKLGQVSGVSLDPDDNVYLFHRGPRVWDANTFQPNNIFNDISSGPIDQSTVAVIHPKTGALLYEWGKQMFYLPHGITVDLEGNVWVTDVAMHQVFKYPPILNDKVNNTLPLLTLGSRFQPGSNLSMFCKPSAVAVMASGEFFISDGYCNSRIIKFAPDGTILLHWGRSTLYMGVAVPPYHFSTPHDLTLAEDKNLLYVSDRENGRIQCFQTNNGSFVYQIQSPDIGDRLFSAAYSPNNGGLLFIVNGADLRSNSVHGSVVNVNLDNFRTIKVFQPNTREELKFESPHDLIVSPNGTSLYVVELKPSRAWKFNLEGLHPTIPKAMERNTVSGMIDQYGDVKNAGTMLVAILITAIVLCFGAVLLTAALVYSRARTRGCSGQCNSANWSLVGRSRGEGFKLGNFLGQQHQGFVKLNSFEESDEDETNVIPSSFA